MRALKPTGGWGWGTSAPCSTLWWRTLLAVQLGKQGCRQPGEEACGRCSVPSRLEGMWGGGAPPFDCQAGGGQEPGPHRALHGLWAPRPPQGSSRGRRKRTTRAGGGAPNWGLRTHPFSHRLPVCLPRGPSPGSASPADHAVGLPRSPSWLPALPARILPSSSGWKGLGVYVGGVVLPKSGCF